LTYRVNANALHIAKLDLSLSAELRSIKALFEVYQKIGSEMVDGDSVAYHRHLDNINRAIKKVNEYRIKGPLAVQKAQRIYAEESLERGSKIDD